ncbi:cpw-wpc domain-containing protein [Cystoisospora suis]|uniref:Cpw-wpc domain-containing protein n=1 Tax=Cystoisospora suis TaxID=483139 RepID=A0A2C6KV89_9APIC|nr:cpw-wpc domain-containing protein [Cystoisospora suis]
MLLQSTTERLDEAAQEDRRLQASAIGYDLTGLEKSMSAEAARRLRAAYAEAGACDHDYSVLCPFSWIDMGDGVNCKAPPAYVGKTATRAAMKR